MGKNSYLVDKTDPASIQALIDAFDARGTAYEDTIRTVLSIHSRPFTLSVDDRADRLSISPLDDAFAFNMDTDELLLFSDNPASLVDALLEMAMFLEGFNTLIGIEDEWKVQVAIGAWRHVRENLKAQYQLMPPLGKLWSASLELETVKRYDRLAFAAMVFLAGRPELDVIFPEGANALVIAAYRRVVRIIETIALGIGLNDHLAFNRRLSRAVLWIEESIMPRDDSPPDGLSGSEGYSDLFLDDESDPAP
jgi:hypothetical protein